MPSVGRGALAWAVWVGCCGGVAAQVNGAIGGHTHTQTPAGGCQAPNLGMGAQAGGLVVENDQSVQTSIETVSTTGVAGHTTYRITLHLQSNAANVYTIYGDSRPLMFPPAYQVPSPFGTNVGGVAPAFYSLNPVAQYDSWLTVGETAGNTDNKVNSVGIDFSQWTDSVGLVSSTDSGGAIFWMDPDDATQGVELGAQPGDRTMVVAQLTVQDANSRAYSQIVHFDAQGRSVGHLQGVSAGPADWEENCIEVMVGGPQHGQGSHSTMNSNGGPMVPGGACTMMTNPQGGTWNYDRMDFAAGTSATLACMVGYTPQDRANTVKYCDNGQWTGGLSASCVQDTPCSQLHDANGAGVYTYSSQARESGSRATLTCMGGYELTSSNAVKICQGGQWVADTEADPSFTLYNFAHCQHMTTEVVLCQNKRGQYSSDPCFLNSGTQEQRNRQQCLAQGSKCRWVLDATVDGAIGGHGNSCEHCMSAPPPPAARHSGSGDSSGGGSGDSSGGGSSSGPVVALLLVVLAGGTYVAFDKKLGPFAPKGENAAGLTGGAGAATIYDKQTDESL